MKKGAGIILQNSKGEILLQLRDNNTNQFPNKWVLLGGSVEAKETPADAIRRELKEEIGLEIDDFTFFKNFYYKDTKQSFFFKKINLPINKIILKEGKEIKYFSIDKIKELKLGFNIREVLNEFFKLSK